MTKPQLLNYAAEMGIAGVDSSMKKAEMIEAIEGAVV
nr:Rho termination factor N-terminal domain-containing protein [Acutalibacter muris]